jgi:multidrug efflux system membrane fusion protein
MSPPELAATARAVGTDRAKAGGGTVAAKAAVVAVGAEAGTVTFIDNTVDPTTGTIKMKGTFNNADHALWPGLFVQVTLILRTDPNAIVVPSVAVQSTQAGQFVFVITPDRTAEVRNVTVERQQGDESVITQGLRPGEEVVTDGQLRLTSGSHVTTGTRGNGAGGGNRSGEGGRRNGGSEGGSGGGGRRGGNRENKS